MNELDKWGGVSPLVPSNMSRASKKTAKSVVEQTRLTGLELEGEAALWGRGMELIADLDNYRQLLAQGNPELNAVLVRFELGFAASAEKTIRNARSPFGL